MILLCFVMLLEDVTALKVVLNWFEIVFCLKINDSKCEMLGIKLTQDGISTLAPMFGCKVRCVPSTYLGMPLCLGMPKKSLWNPVIDHFETQLSSWKATHLCFGGRITMLKSGLASLPVYFVSCFRCPSLVIKTIEKIQRQFLWNDSYNQKKFHLVQ